MRCSIMKQTTKNIPTFSMGDQNASNHDQVVVSSGMEAPGFLDWGFLEEAV